MTPDEYVVHDALGLAELVRRRHVTPQELLETAISLAERINPTINAIVRPMYDEAFAYLEAGSLPDAAPFRGVPILLKDLRAEVAGVPTTRGSRYFIDAVPNSDSELVSRLKRAGFVIFGKTNTPELGGNITTEPALHGPTRNPWDLSRIAGGSSGGSAAAVAGGIVPLAHASDGGGSIRIPASCCGVVGLKPSRGRIPAGPRRGEYWSGLSTEHGITRSVRDTAALLDATAGPSPGDPYACPPAGPFLEAVKAEKRMRIAFSTVAPSGVPVTADAVHAVEQTAALCESLGHRVVEASPAIDVSKLSQRMVLVAANLAADVAERAASLGREPASDELEQVTVSRVRYGESLSAPDLVRATWAIHALGREVAQFFLDYDLFLTPTVVGPAPLLGSFPMDGDADDLMASVSQFVPFTALYNATGQPAVSLPMHRDGVGLPIGVQFAAAYGREDDLLSIAGMLEDARNWASEGLATVTGEVPAS